MRHFTPKPTKEQRLAKQAESSLKRKQSEALSLISQYQDIFNLLSDAVFLGQVSSQQKAYDYVLDVRNQRYLSESPTWKERSELFRLASSQRI